MNLDEQFWQRFGGMIRKATGECAPSPEEAQKMLDAIPPAQELPLTSKEIEQAIAQVLGENESSSDAESQTGWTDSYANSGVEDDVFALNCNKGEADAEVDAKIKALRKKAADEVTSGTDETGLADPQKPTGEGG